MIWSLWSVALWRGHWEGFGLMFANLEMLLRQAPSFGAACLTFLRRISCVGVRGVGRGKTDLGCQRRLSFLVTA